MAGEQISGRGAHGGGFGAATVERVGGEAPALGLSCGLNRPPGKRQQLGFEVCGDDFDVDAAEVGTDMQSGSAHRFGVVVLSVTLLAGT